jgi:hypothetical protein
MDLNLVDRGAHLINYFNLELLFWLIFQINEFNNIIPMLVSCCCIIIIIMIIIILWS